MGASKKSASVEKERLAKRTFSLPSEIKKAWMPPLKVRAALQRGKKVFSPKTKTGVYFNPVSQRKRGEEKPSSGFRAPRGGGGIKKIPILNSRGNLTSKSEPLFGGEGLQLLKKGGKKATPVRPVIWRMYRKLPSPGGGGQTTQQSRPASAPRRGVDLLSKRIGMATSRHGTTQNTCILT